MTLASAYVHTFKSGDVDLDGERDLVTAEMHQSPDPDDVAVYLNGGRAASWRKQVIAGSGSHNVRLVDLDRDGDLDVFGANWDEGAPNGAVFELWRNELGAAGASRGARPLAPLRRRWCEAVAHGPRPRRRPRRRRARRGRHRRVMVSRRRHARGVGAEGARVAAVGGDFARRPVGLPVEVDGGAKGEVGDAGEEAGGGLDEVGRSAPSAATRGRDGECPMPSAGRAGTRIRMSGGAS